MFVDIYLCVFFLVGVGVKLMLGHSTVYKMRI